MFIPLHDANGLKHIRAQYVTIGIIVINGLVWLATGLGGMDSAFTTAAVLGLGFIPAVVNDFAELAPGLALVPEGATYVSYAFLHGSFLHVAGNMLFVWVFGDNVEDAMGHWRFLFFYLACAAGGAFLHQLLLPQSEAPLIGASGAVAGVVAAYLILHPRVRLWVLAFGRIPLPLPAYIPLLLWVGYQFVMLATGIGGNVSFAAHVGGLLAGALLVVPLRRAGVPLFDRRIVTPKAVQHGKERPQRGRWGRQSQSD